jgi:hypothetical protein
MEINEIYIRNAVREESGVNMQHRKVTDKNR